MSAGIMLNVGEACQSTWAYGATGRDVPNRIQMLYIFSFKSFCDPPKVAERLAAPSTAGGRWKELETRWKLQNAPEDKDDPNADPSGDRRSQTSPSSSTTIQTTDNAYEQLKQEEETEDVEVTWEDQQRICTFSKLNTRYRGYEERLNTLREEKEALDDLTTEIELADEDQPILYRIGETFVHLPLPRALKRLERDTTALSDEISKLGDQAEKTENEMKELKLTLYAKFGSAINLDE